MNQKGYGRDRVIFREGDPGDCMYEVLQGRVGIYRDYRGENEQKLAELFPDQLFGEMGLLDYAPRSATAVALEDETILRVIPEDEFYSYFEEKPAEIFLLMQQMCHRLRRTTQDYLDACRTVSETAEAEKLGAKKSETLLEKIAKLCSLYQNAYFFTMY